MRYEKEQISSQLTIDSAVSELERLQEASDVADRELTELRRIVAQKEEEAKNAKFEALKQHNVVKRLEEEFRKKVIVLYFPK
jgi:hypothetical protein